MSVHVSGRGSTSRRIVLSCDVAGCPVQVEPPPAERWRSDTDAKSWARDRAVGWTHDPVRGTDYCPEHAEHSTPPDEGVVAPRPTATARDRAGNPLNRDDYAARLLAQLVEDTAGTGGPKTLTAGQAYAVARLLDELAGVYRDEDLGALARQMSELLDPRRGGSDL